MKTKGVALAILSCFTFIPFLTYAKFVKAGTRTCKVTDPLTVRRIAAWEKEDGDLMTILPSSGSCN